MTQFSQPGKMAIKNIEQLILNAINGLEYQNKLEDVLSDYGEEINHYRLSTQLLILKTKFAVMRNTISPVINYMKNNVGVISALINYIKNNIGVQTSFYSEIIFLKFLCRHQWMF